MRIYLYKKCWVYIQHSHSLGTAWFFHLEHFIYAVDEESKVVNQMVSETMQEFIDNTIKLYKLLKGLEGETIEKVVLVPLSGIPDDKKGLFQGCPLIGFQFLNKDDMLCINVERILYDIWNKTRVAKI